jgi:hypothetical protein
LENQQFGDEHGLVGVPVGESVEVIGPASSLYGSMQIFGGVPHLNPEKYAEKGTKNRCWILLYKSHWNWKPI